MKKLILTLFISLYAFSAFALSPAQQDVLRAMEDEMIRSILSLKMDDMAKPYFITYKVSPFTRISFSANMGVATAVSETSSTNTKVSMRVGGPKDDNSFFDTYIYSMSEAQYPTSGYNGIRAALWDETNKAYKDALNQLAKKRAYKKTKNITENYADFSPAKATRDIQEITAAVTDNNYWKDLTGELSAQGNLSELESFRVTTTVSFEPEYFLTNEGARYLKDRYLISIIMNASAKTKNGFELKESKKFIYSDFKDVPAREELITKAKDFAREAAAFTKSDKAEAFIGPVMLEGGAAAALLNGVFVNKISNTKPVLSEDSDPSQGEFSRKAGLKVMPVDFDVTDDPAQTEYKGKKLAGSYMVDAEGTAAQRIDIIKNGKLTELPTTRSLIKDQKTSNGHAKLDMRGYLLFAQAGVSNLFFTPHTTIPKADFKTKFMQYCREEGLDYCYIIKGSPLGAAVSAYKMDAKTGKETPVHGAVMSDILNSRTLRDIKYAADDSEAYNLFSDLSIITPSIILSEAEVKPTQKVATRKPLVPKP